MEIKGINDIFFKYFFAESEDKILLCLAIGVSLLSFIKQLQPVFSLQKPPNFWLLSLGIILLIIYLVRWQIHLKQVKIDKLGKGFVVNIGKEHAIQFVNDNLANISCDKHEVIVLPINDTFDSPCLNDNRSATGAFIIKHFPTGLNDIVKSMAFPCISTGVFGYPNDLAAEIAISEIKIFFR
ncbi:MAG: macro domain-containing protein [Treponema sp.]|nr:macro domain-containing protein [Treponema sp.]